MWKLRHFNLVVVQNWSIVFSFSGILSLEPLVQFESLFYFCVDRAKRSYTLIMHKTIKSFALLTPPMSPICNTTESNLCGAWTRAPVFCSLWSWLLSKAELSRKKHLFFPRVYKANRFQSNSIKISSHYFFLALSRNATMNTYSRLNNRFSFLKLTTIRITWHYGVVACSGGYHIK